jgi:hypothetical protein
VKSGLKLIRTRVTSFLDVVVFGIALALVCENSQAVIVSAGTGSFADVSKAVSLARAGDTVQIPPGTNVWTSTLWATNGISIQGAGIDQTVIIDEIPRSSTSTALLIFSASTNQSFRLSGVTLRGGVTNTTLNWDGALRLFGSSRSFRLDHVKFDNLHASNLYISGWLYGVVDHCLFNAGAGTEVRHTSWNGLSYGDGSWADQTYWGTEKAVYFEDNQFSDQNSSGVVDGYAGARFVFRYNTVTNGFIVNHGTDSTQRYRSCRSMEIYGNTFYWSPTARNAPWPFAIYSRGGGALIFSNSFSGAFGSMATVANYRSTTNPEGFPWPPWGPCLNTVQGTTGPSAYDGNTDNLGYPAIDQVGRGAGDLLRGDSTPLPAAWPHQVLDPLYQWSNTVSSGIRANIGSQQSIIQANRDWYDQIPKPNYTPFPYPHPLISGAVKPPAPVNLRVVGGG